MLEKSPLENAFALIIGISNYKDPNIRKLKYTRADAEGINKILTDPKKVGLNPEKIKNTDGSPWPGGNSALRGSGRRLVLRSRTNLCQVPSVSVS